MYVLSCTHTSTYLYTWLVSTLIYRTFLTPKPKPEAKRQVKTVKQWKPATINSLSKRSTFRKSEVPSMASVQVDHTHLCLLRELLGT